MPLQTKKHFQKLWYAYVQDQLNEGLIGIRGFVALRLTRTQNSDLYIFSLAIPNEQGWAFEAKFSLVAPYYGTAPCLKFEETPSLLAFQKLLKTEIFWRNFEKWMITIVPLHYGKFVLLLVYWFLLCFVNDVNHQKSFSDSGGMYTKSFNSIS